MSSPIRPARVLFPLGLAVCLSLYGDLTLYAVLVTQLDVVGLTLASMGIMLSVNRLVRIPGNPLGGLLADRFGRRPLFLLGMLLGVLTTASYGLLRGFWPWLIARALWGVAWILIHVSGMSMVLDISTPATRGRHTGIYTTWQQIGFALGPLLGGLLVDTAGFRPAMLVGAGLTTVGLLVALLALPETAPRARPQPDRPPAPIARPRPAALLRRAAGLLSGHRNLVIASALFLILRFAGEGVVRSTVSVLLQQRFGTQVLLGRMALGVASLSGLLLGGRALLISVAGPLAGQLSDGPLGRLWVIAGGLVLGMVSFVVLAEADTLAAVLVSIILGALGAGASLTTLAAWVGDMTPAGRQGMVMGLYTAVGDAGGMAGPLVAFALIAVTDLSWIFVLSVVVSALGLGLLWLGARRPVPAAAGSETA